MQLVIFTWYWDRGLENYGRPEYYNLTNLKQENFENYPNVSGGEHGMYKMVFFWKANFLLLILFLQLHFLFVTN